MRKEVTLRMEESRFDQFMGFIRLYSEVEIISEGQCKRTGRGGRPKRASKPVTKGFCYRCQNEAVRLMMLYKGLVALGWISSDTDCQQFIDLFGGGDFRGRIVWTGPANVLAELFRRLVNERQLVGLPEKHSLWVMVNGHFWNKEKNEVFGTERLRNTHIPFKQSQTIAYLVDLLDPENALDDIRKMMESQR